MTTMTMTTTMTITGHVPSRLQPLLLMLVVLTITTLRSTVHASLPTYYMDEWCTTTLDLGVQNIHAGRFLLRPHNRGLRYLDCFVFLKAPQGRRLSFSVQDFDLESPFGCEEDHIQIFDDWGKRRELTGRMCNSGERPEGMYTTTSREALVQLMKKRYLADQVEIIFTSFHLAPCSSGEFQCGNSHCISESLYCNDYDNCGDRSDICLLSTPAIIAVVISAIVIVILIAVIVAFIVYRRKQHHRTEKLRTSQYVVVRDGSGRPVLMQEDLVHYVHPWEDHHHHRKSPIPGGSSASTSSSRLSVMDKADKAGSDFFGVGPNDDYPWNEDTLTKRPLGGDSFSSTKKNTKRSSGKSLLRATSFNKRSSSKKSHQSQLGSGVQDIYAVPKKKSSSSQKKKKKRFSWRRRSSPKYANALSLHQQYHQQPFSTSIDPLFITPPPPPFLTEEGEGETTEMKVSRDNRETMRDEEVHNVNNNNDGERGTTSLRRPGVIITGNSSSSNGGGGGGEGMWEQAERDMPAPIVHVQHVGTPQDPQHHVHTLDPSSLPGASHHLHPPPHSHHGPGETDDYDHVMSFRSYQSPEQRRKERVVYLYPGGHPGYHRLQRHGSQGALVTSERASVHSGSRSSLVKL